MDKFGEMLKFGAQKLKEVLLNIIKPYIPYIIAFLAAVLLILIIIGMFGEWEAATTEGGTASESGMNNASTASSSSMEQLIKFIHTYEGGGEIFKNSEGVDCYKVVSDGSATGSAVGYGVDIGVHGEELRQKGYETTIGSLIPTDIVDALEQRIREDMVNQVKAATNGLELKEYQIYALVSRAYNCGVYGALNETYGAESLDFTGYYNKYWDQQSDDKYGAAADKVDYNHNLYKNYMSVPVTSDGEYLAGLERRRKSEWILFQTGYYDILGEHWQESYTGNFNNINVYNNDGSVNEEKIQELQLALESSFNLVKGNLNGNNIGGRYNKESCTKVTGTYLGYSGRTGATTYSDANISYIGNNDLWMYQCTWWANGRASEYLSKYGTKYKSYPSAAGNGGEIYLINESFGWFASGSNPKPNSLVSYSGGSDYGHVAYVEAVDNVNGYYYISHAGSGLSWYGIQKVKIGEAPWGGWTIEGFVYLDEPL